MEIENKRNLIRIYAKSIGICPRCFRWNIEAKKASCQKCLDNNAKRAKKRRKILGNCNRCGQKNDRFETGKKTCTKCNNQYKKHANNKQI